MSLFGVKLLDPDLNYLVQRWPSKVFLYSVLASISATMYRTMAADDCTLAVRGCHQKLLFLEQPLGHNSLLNARECSHCGRRGLTSTQPIAVSEGTQTPSEEFTKRTVRRGSF